MAKFTIEQVLEKIKTKFTNAEGKTSLQVSDRTVKETLEPFMSLVADDVELDSFIDQYAFKAIDSANRNYGKFTADWFKEHPDTKVPPKQEEKLDVAEILKQLQESQKNQLEELIKPFQAQIAQLNDEKLLAQRADAIKAKKAELKLTKNWDVDFDNSVTIATLKLGKDATADQIFEEAKKHFNDTLSARGEVYKPQEGDGGGSDKLDFSGVNEMLKQEAAAKAK